MDEVELQIRCSATSSETSSGPGAREPIFRQTCPNQTKQICFVKMDVVQHQTRLLPIQGQEHTCIGQTFPKQTNKHKKKPTKRCFVKKFKFAALQHQTRPPQAQEHVWPAAEAGSWKDCKQRRGFFHHQQVGYKQPSFPIKSWCSSGKVDSCYNFFSKFPRPGEVFISCQVKFKFLTTFVSLLSCLSTIDISSGSRQIHGLKAFQIIKKMH